MSTATALRTCYVHEAKGLLLSAADKACYAADGAIILRGAIPAEAFDAIEKDLLARIDILEKHHDIVPTEGLNARLLQLYEKLPDSQSALYDAMPLAPSLSRFAALEAIQHVTAQLLSPAVSIHPRRLLLMSPPQNEWHLPVWHQDWYYNEGPALTLTLYAPLQRTTPHNGGLKLALGEWKNGVLPHDRYDHGVQSKWQSISPEAVQAFRAVAEPELERGDILLFNSLVPHSAQVNRSSAVRMVVNLRFQDLTDKEFTDSWWRTGAISHAREALARKDNKG